MNVIKLAFAMIGNLHARRHGPRETYSVIASARLPALLLKEPFLLQLLD